MDISRAMIRAILFDLDDLMIDSAPLHIEASRRVFSKLGVDIDLIPADIISSYFGKRTSEIVRIIAEYFKVDRKIDIEKVIKERDSTFLELVVKKGVRPMPGLAELVKLLRPLKVKKAVASSGRKEYIEVALDKLNLKGFFQAISAGDMVKNGKPAPDIFLKAAELLNVAPPGCIVIEDSTMGVIAAKAAGMICIGVANSVSPYRQGLSEADAVVGRLDEIDMKLLARLGLKV